MVPAWQAVGGLARGVHAAVEFVPPASVGGRLPGAVLRQVANDGGRSQRAGWPQSKSGDELSARIMAAALSRADVSKRGDALHGHLERRVHDDERAHPAGIRGRVLESNRAAHRVADQHEIAQVELLDHLRQVRRVTLVGVRRRIRPLAVAVAALIQRDYAIGRDEARRDEVEPVRVGGAAVQAQHGGTIRRAVILIVQTQAAGLDEPALVGGGQQSVPAGATHIGFRAYAHTGDE